MKIAARYRPFSHRPGCACLIPTTACLARIYPVAFILQDSLGNDVKYVWDLTGPVKNFTIIQDLENQSIVVYGIAQQGYFSYRLFCRDQSVVLELKRGPIAGIRLDMPSESRLIHVKDTVVLCKRVDSISCRKLEKLSFGNHKAQDWDRIHQRNDPLEYLPFWFALGQQVPSKKTVFDKGNYVLLTTCQKLLQDGDKEGFLDALQKLFTVGFQDLLIPKLYDDDYLGIGDFEKNQSTQLPVSILSKGYELIRQMLFQQKGNTLYILPVLPPLFHAGRCLNLRFENSEGKLSALIDLEWSKKLLKKVKITSFEKQTLQFCFQKPLKRFRLKHPLHQIGKEYGSDESIEIHQGVYLLDCFKK